MICQFDKNAVKHACAGYFRARLLALEDGDFSELFEIESMFV